MKITILALALSISACGFLDAGTTAATTAKLKADEAKQAQEAKDRITAGIADAAEASQQRLQAAEQQQ